ncbi:MAG TPA: hypothetical protein VLE43_13805, partial [Candidatus Saccharimonadia bacterium]|nr:hypothetical protein [Candidatus Saccharimonadia bacterium]
MTREEFDALVTRLDRRLGKRPGRLKLELVLCACLAFALMFAWTGLLLLIAVLCLVIIFVGGVNEAGGFFLLMGLACLFLFLAGRSLVALMIRLEPPQGKRLKRDEAPELFDLIEEVRRRLG